MGFKRHFWNRVVEILLLSVRSKEKIVKRFIERRGSVCFLWDDLLRNEILEQHGKSTHTWDQADGVSSAYTLSEFFPAQEWEIKCHREKNSMSNSVCNI